MTGPLPPTPIDAGPNAHDAAMGLVEGVDREAIARIIDLVTWRESDDYRSIMAEYVRKSECAQSTVDHMAYGRVALSLVKADAILASLAPPAAEREVETFAEWLRRYVGQQDAKIMRFSVAELEIAFNAGARQ